MQSIYDHRQQPKSSIFSVFFCFVVITCLEPLTYNECISCCPVSCHQQSQCVGSELPCIDGCYCPDGKFCFSNMYYLIPFNFLITFSQVYISTWHGQMKALTGTLYKYSASRVWMNDRVFLSNKSLFLNLTSRNRFQQRSVF